MNFLHPSGSREKGVIWNSAYIYSLPPPDSISDRDSGDGTSETQERNQIGEKQHPFRDHPVEMVGAEVGDLGHLSSRPLVQDPAVPGLLKELLGWIYRGWSIVSLGLLVVMLVVAIDSRRAARFFNQVGLKGYPFYASDGNGTGGGGGEYDPTADGGFSGVSEASILSAGSGSGNAAGTGGSAGFGTLVTAGGGGGAVASGVKGEVRVGCLTVSDEVLGYGSHGTVVYRGLLEGRPVAVKRMLTDFHARADREISLLIESDG